MNTMERITTLTPVAAQALRAEIQDGLADIDAGRVRDFDAERIIRRGEERLRDHGGDCA